MAGVDTGPRTAPSSAARVPGPLPGTAGAGCRREPGAVSRLETGRGLATPLLIVLKINGALARQLRGLDPTLLSADLRAALDLQGPLIPSNAALALRDVPLAADPRLDELVRLYHETPARRRPSMLSVLRAMVAGLQRAVPLVLASFV